MVHLFGDSAQISFWEKIDLVRLCVFVEVSRKAFIPALVSLLIVRRIIRHYMTPGIDNRIRNCKKKRLSGFARRNAHDLSLLDSLPSAECEIDQDIGIFF